SKRVRSYGVPCSWRRETACSVASCFTRLGRRFGLPSLRVARPVRYLWRASIPWRSKASAIEVGNATSLSAIFKRCSAFARRSTAFFSRLFLGSSAFLYGRRFYRLSTYLTTATAVFTEALLHLDPRIFVAISIRSSRDKRLGSDLAWLVIETPFAAESRHR